MAVAAGTVHGSRCSCTLPALCQDDSKQQCWVLLCSLLAVRGCGEALPSGSPSCPSQPSSRRAGEDPPSLSAKGHLHTPSSFLPSPCAPKPLLSPSNPSPSPAWAATRLSKGSSTASRTSSSSSRVKATTTRALGASSTRSCGCTRKWRAGPSRHEQGTAHPSLEPSRDSTEQC